MRKIEVLKKGESYSLLKEQTKYSTRYIVAYLFNGKAWVSGHCYNSLEDAEKAYTESEANEQSFWNKVNSREIVAW